MFPLQKGTGSIPDGGTKILQKNKQTNKNEVSVGILMVTIQGPESFYGLMAHIDSEFYMLL